MGATAIQSNSIMSNMRVTDSSSLGIEDANITVFFYNDAGKVSTAYSETFENSTDSNGYFTGKNLIESADASMVYGRTYYMDFTVNGLNYNFTTEDTLPFKAWFGQNIDITQVNATSIYQGSNQVIDTSSGYLTTQIDTQGEVETIWGVTLATDGELSTGLASQDACSEITGCVENAITSSALTDYYLKTAIDTQGELETIWGVTLLNTASTLDATKLSGNLPAIDGSALTGIAGGDSWSDAVDSNIVPDGNNTRELGSLQNQFNKMYLKYGYVDNSIEKNGYPSQGIYFGTNAMSIRLQNPTAVALNIEQGLVTINDGGVDTNFKIKGDNDANLFYTDASTDRIGIGTATPSEKLHIVGNQIITGYINSTVATGKIMDFQNGCSLQQNSTDLWFEC